MASTMRRFSVSVIIASPAPRSTAAAEGAAPAGEAAAPGDAAADLDTYLALVRGNDQKRAGVLLLLSDSPVSPELIAVILDRGALQRLESDDDQLPGGLGLELRELALERGLGLRIENSGIV